MESKEKMRFLMSILIAVKIIKIQELECFIRFFGGSQRRSEEIYVTPESARNRKKKAVSLQEDKVRRVTGLGM